MAAPHSPEALAQAIDRLLEHRALRLRIAAKGLANIQQFTWRRATDAFEAALRHSSAETPQERALIRS